MLFQLWALRDGSSLAGLCQGWGWEEQGGHRGGSGGCIGPGLVGVSLL